MAIVQFVTSSCVSIIKPDFTFTLTLKNIYPVTGGEM